jgi:hypothetical protein
MLILMHVEARHLFFLKCLLQTFAVSTKLKVNYSKSFIVLINVMEKTRILAGILGCQIGTKSITYLGLPLAPPNQSFRTS